MLRLCPKGRKAYSASILIPNPISARFRPGNGVQFPNPHSLAVSVQERRLNSGCTIAPTCNVLSADNTSFLILLYRSRQRKAIRLIEKEEKNKKDSILIFCGISDRVKRKGFETEHEEKELLWISKIWLLSYM